MMLYIIFQYLMILGALAVIGYLFILGILALLPSSKRDVETSFNHSFLIVVYSHNDEEQISKTLYSLTGLVYPWNLYDMMVFADDCTDDTAAVSEKFGAKVIERTLYGQKSSTDIILWTFNYLKHMDEEYDAIVFIGSNGLVSGNFLEVMNLYLKQGSTVIQSSNLRISTSRTIVTNYKRICWLLYTYINALGRKKIGLKTMPLGSGMCFESDALKAKFDELNSAHDDNEYSFSLQPKDFHVDFAPEAVVWSHLDDSSKEEKLEQLPWIIKKVQIVKKYLINSSSNLSVSQLLQNHNILTEKISLPLIMIFSIALVNFILNLILWALGYILAWLWVAWMVLIVKVMVYFLIGVITDRVYSPSN